jgi:hypothetical protein
MAEVKDVKQVQGFSPTTIQGIVDIIGGLGVIWASIQSTNLTTGWAQVVKGLGEVGFSFGNGPPAPAPAPLNPVVVGKA